MVRRARSSAHQGRFSGLWKCGAVAGILLAAGPGTHASPPEPPAPFFRHVTTAHGLPDPRVQSMLQDRVGFLWVGTLDGLGRYDGRRFRTFRHDPSDPTTLGPGIPVVLLEDSRGRIWGGLRGGGLSCFDPATERFRQYRHDPTSAESLSDNVVADLLEDEEGRLWVATNAGLDRLDPDSGLVTRHAHDPGDGQSLGGRVVRSLARDAAGGLWIGTGDAGLNRMTIDSGGKPRFARWRHDPRQPRSLPSDNVERVLVDRKGRVWVGTWEAGVARYDTDRDEFLPQAAMVARAPRAPVLIQDLLEDRHGAIWVAVWGSGLVRIDADSGQATRYPADPDEPESLSHGNVWALLEDRSGLLWAATGGGGLNVLDLEPQPFTRFGLRGAGVRDARAVLEDRAGRVWVGTAGGGLLRLDRSGRVIEHHRHRPGDPTSLGDDNVLALLEDRHGEIWIGTFKGVDRFDRVGGRFIHHRHDSARAGSLSSDLVFSVFEDGRGRLWVGTDSGLDLMVDRTRGHFRRYSPKGRTETRPGTDAVVAITEDSKGILWASVRGGVARLDEARGHLVPMSLRPDGVDDETVAWCIRPASSGSLWVVQGSDLFEVLPGTDSLPRIRHHTPFPEGGEIATFESDDLGRLWLGTSRGLVRYDPLRGQARRYDPDEGALGGGFNLGKSAAFRTPRGDIYFGATSGLMMVRPERVRDQVTPPAVVFTDLRLGDRTISVGSVALPRALPRLHEIRLPYGERQLTVGFAALDFRTPRQGRSRYRLEGFDPGWNELPPDRQEVTYTNLSPRRYRLRVAAANADGVWNGEGAALDLQVLPPFWGTWWFRVLAAAGVASALFGVHRARTYAVQAKNRRLEREVRELRLIADALPVLIGYLDAQHRCVFLNRTCEAWVGRPRGELEGKRVEELLPAELMAAGAPLLARALAGAGGTQEFEVDAAGSRRRLVTTLVPHADGSGSFPGVYFLAQDMTDRVRTEEALRRQQDELAHASRMLTLGELAAAIAHEVNQPLTAILSTAQAALRLKARADPAPDDVSSALRDIASSARRGGEIVWKLQDLVRKGESKREVLDVNASIRGLEPLLNAGAVEADVTIELDLSPSLGRPRGDAIQIQQVVLNLARNAFDAMKGVPRGSRHLRIRSLPRDAEVVVEVRDSGPPVGDEAFERLFSPFFSTKADGLGMGLSICRSILEAHGGEIVGERNPGGGLTIRFRLPLSPPAASTES